MRWWFLFFFVSRDGGERRASPTGGYGQRWTPEYNFFFSFTECRKGFQIWLFFTFSLGKKHVTPKNGPAS